MIKNLAILSFLIITSTSCATPAIQQATNSISVTDFGALGDGVTNNTRFFARAFEACANNKEVNNIFIPNGIYLLDSLVIEGFQGLTIEGGGSFTTRLVATGVANSFLQIGSNADSRKKRQAVSMKHCRIEGFRIEGRNNTRVGMHITNAQDNLLQRIEINGFDVGLKLEFSWINTVRHFRFINYKKFGVFLEGSGLNANLFESCRATSLNSQAVAYRVAGNSSTFMNCTAEGGGIGWEFQYCRKSSLIGCHSENGTPFRVLKKVGLIGIDGHFIWKPQSIWDASSSARAEAISMRNCYIYTLEGEKSNRIPATNVVTEGNLQSKVY